MNNWLEKLLDVTAVGNNEATLKSALANLAERFDFVGYAFVNLRPGQTYAVSNYDTEWQGIYHKLGYRFIDPVMQQAQRIKKAFAWSGEVAKTAFSSEERTFFLQAADFNIRSGVSIPSAPPMERCRC